MNILLTIHTTGYVPGIIAAVILVAGWLMAHGDFFFPKYFTNSQGS